MKQLIFICLIFLQTNVLWAQEKQLVLKKQKGVRTIRLTTQKLAKIKLKNNKELLGLIHSFSDSSITLKRKIFSKNDSLSTEKLKDSLSINFSDIQAIHFAKKDSGREIEGNLWLGVPGIMLIAISPIVVIAGISNPEYLAAPAGLLGAGAVLVGQAYLAYKTTQPKTYDLKHKWKLVVK